MDKSMTEQENQVLTEEKKKEFEKQPDNESSDGLTVVEMGSFVIDRKVDIWKNKLLDLGKRNRLINYRETKRSTLTIIEPEIYDLWDSIVENNEPLSFPMYFETPEEEGDDTDYDEEIDESADVKTNQNIKDMQKTLRNLRNNAKTAIEEQGINLLYLGFGFLNWSETSIERNPMKSPLILVPVSLTVESITDPFVLQVTDDEIVVNPALKYKLANDYGISLPDFDDALGLEYFLDATKSVITNDWNVSEEVGLSLFSFLKINMYNDLSKNKDSIKTNRNVRAIAGDGAAVQTIPSELTNFDFDRNLKPIDNFQVVDADSSQQEAILCAKKGISFVLQGPPGTGKSQTITNIIAECLADGKKVLFVSEKKAALDVVHKRLTSAGLDDFCLVLHSHKANKKEVLEQLRTSLNLAKNKAQLSDEAAIKLETLYQDRKKLNDYADQIYKIVDPLKMTIYQVNGILASVNDYPEAIFGIRDVRKTSFTQYNRYLYVLTNFKNIIGKMSEDYDSNPWKGSNVAFVTNELRHDISAKLPLLSEQLGKADAEIIKMFSSVSLDYECSYNRLHDVIALFDIAKNSPTIPNHWIAEENLKSFFEKTNDYEILTDAFSEKVKELDTLYSSINSKGVLAVPYKTTKQLNSISELDNEMQALSELEKNDPILSRIENGRQFNTMLRDRRLIEEKTTQISLLKNGLYDHFTDEITDFNYKEMLTRYQDSYFSLMKDVSVKTGDLRLKQQISQKFAVLPEQWLRTDLEKLYRDAQECENLQTSFFTAKDNLRNVTEILVKDGVTVNIEPDQLTTYESLKTADDYLRQGMIRHSIMSKLESFNAFEQCKSELVIAENKAIKLRELRDKVLENFDRGIFDLDCEGMLERFKLEYNSIFKILNGNYRDDRKQLTLLYKRTEKLDDSTIISALSDVKEMSQIRDDIDKECENIINVFESDFRYEDTNFPSMHYMLKVYSELKEALSYIDSMLNICQMLDPKDDVKARKFGLLYSGLDTVWEDIFKVIEWAANSKTLLKNDLYKFQQYYKDDSVDVPEAIVFESLCNLERIEDTKEECVSMFPLFISVMDEIFDYEKTDYSKVDAYLDTYASVFNSLRILMEMKTMMVNLNNNEEVLQETYGLYYKKMCTSWEDIRNALNWTLQFKAAIEKYSPNDEFIERICSDSNAIDCCSTYRDYIEKLLNDIDGELNWFADLFEDKKLYEQKMLKELSTHTERCANGLSLIEEWIDYVNARKDCLKEGLDDYIRQFELQKFAPNQIIPVFQKRFFRLWLDAVLPEYPAILNFRRMNQENTIREFVELDKTQFEISKARIKSKLINNLPLLDSFTSGMDEVGILKRELSKQRKIMPIRKLFNQIPNLLMTLKPCLMMSPLSVSLFLESDSYLFDTVIFDEASQVCTENAIGAIVRGKQVIITGDSKQLPPTNFFTSSTSDADDYDTDDEIDDTAAYESILDEANLLPERTLLWHYRSRHENLIAFSNAKIYHHNLVTFPSNVENQANNGVEYFYVKEGFYDRGGKKGNIPEAKRVAEMIFQHFNQFPHRSLGVITFGEVQQQAIETEVRYMRMKNQQYEEFFSEDKEDAFFIKNLENVQGDERDTIIFSIGYAKDKNGVFRMNFGPLSKAGGERRLNVAITRAKYNVKLVGSILPTDINTDRVTAEGPKLLRSYIDFALHGSDILEREWVESDVVQHDSPFEKAVYNFLDRKGYRLATQVGCSGYRIDMAVKHPTISGQYVLGIECDGASYHSARTARDRDRLRQDVLEKMGWTIYRIWSTDWIKDPIAEGNRLVEKVEHAIANYGVKEPEKETEKTETEEFVSIEEKVETLDDIANPYGFQQEAEVSFSDLPRPNGYLISTHCVMRIINTLYPVHYDVICQHMAPLYGNMKVTVTIKRRVNNVLRQLENDIIQKDDFYYPADYTNVTPRVNNRKIKHISNEELSEAMFTVLSKRVGLTKELLCTECARAYNFRRMNASIIEAMNTAFDTLLEQNRIEIVGDKVIIKQEE